MNLEEGGILSVVLQGCHELDILLLTRSTLLQTLPTKSRTTQSSSPQAGCMVRQVVWTAVQQFEGSQHGRRVGRRAVATKQNLLTLPFLQNVFSRKSYANHKLFCVDQGNQYFDYCLESLYRDEQI